MKTFLFAAAGALALGMSGAAFADHHEEGEGPELSEGAKQFEQGCLGYKAEYGTTADCTCLAETFDADPEFAGDMMSVMGPEDVANLSEVTLEKIAACEPADGEM